MSSPARFRMSSFLKAALQIIQRIPAGSPRKGLSQRVYDNIRRPYACAVCSWHHGTGTKGKLRREYWDRLQGERMSSGVSYVAFGGAVNTGVAQPVKWLQRALQAVGLYEIDGLVGQGTLQAHDGVNDNGALISRIIAAGKPSAVRSDMEHLRQGLAISYPRRPQDRADMGLNSRVYRKLATVDG